LGNIRYLSTEINQTLKLVL